MPKILIILMLAMVSITMAQQPDTTMKMTNTQIVSTDTTHKALPKKKNIIPVKPPTNWSKIKDLFM